MYILYLSPFPINKITTETRKKKRLKDSVECKIIRVIKVVIPQSIRSITGSLLPLTAPKLDIDAVTPAYE
jgi:hypothetical protein